MVSDGRIWIIYLFYNNPKYNNFTKNIVVSLVLTLNGERDGAILNLIIGSSVVVDSDIRNFLLVWIDISSHRLTVPIIGAGGGRWNMLKPYLTFFQWKLFSEWSQ